jgi:hypothetical protein
VVRADSVLSVMHRSGGKGGESWERERSRAGWSGVERDSTGITQPAWPYGLSLSLLARRLRKKLSASIWDMYGKMSSEGWVGEKFQPPPALHHASFKFKWEGYMFVEYKVVDILERRART